MQTIRILIIEDDLNVLSILLGKLYNLEEQLIGKTDFAITVISEYKEVEDYINKREKDDYDIILLDHDSKECGSFHVLDLEKYNLDKIIAISSNTKDNETIKQKGVNKICRKEFDRLDEWANKVVFLIRQITEKKAF